MRKLVIFFATVLLFLQYGYSQQPPRTWSEDFDGVLPPTGWSASSSDFWMPSSVLHQPGSSTSSPQSYWGWPPDEINDSITLETDIYDCRDYDYVYLQFNHICKVSPLDEARIEYRLNMGGGMGHWAVLQTDKYRGSGVYNGKFDASSYPDWQASNISEYPAQSWWKEELFDIGLDVGRGEVQFRFIIKRGNTEGTDASSGWFLENFRLTAAKNELNPPIVQFVAPFVRDTVYSTGPFEINAKVKTTSNAPIEKPYLKYTATRNGVPIATDSLEMEHVRGDSLWRISIPQFEVGTKITYSITGTDSLGNESAANLEYVIARPPKGELDFVIVGTGTTTVATNPYAYNFNWSYSRNYYLSEEINPNKTGGFITGIAFYNTQTVLSNVDNVAFYVKATFDAVNTTTDYIDPIADGATLVWGSARASTNGLAGWIIFQFQTPFYLPPGMNLLVYCDDKDGSYSGNGNATYRYTLQPTNTSVYVYADGTVFPPTTNRYINGNRPNARFYVMGDPELDNSVAMVSINSPANSDVEGTLMPVHVTIRNKGINNLDSCLVSWSLNGDYQGTVSWYGNLPWDFTDTITLGYYNQLPGWNNNIDVWVHIPNGVVDSAVYDDTLKKMSMGCSSSVLNGTVTVGAGRDAATINDAFNVLRDCGVSRDITFLVDNGTYPENINLTNINGLIGNYSLTIRSASGDRDSVRIRPASGIVFLLNNSHNITFKDITIDASAGTATAYGIQFTGNASNIMVNNCVISANPGLTATTLAPIYKASGTGSLDRLTIKHCVLDGGYYGTYLYGATASYCQNITIDSNTYTNQYYYGMYNYYVNFNSVSYNNVTPRSANQGTIWYGIHLYQVRNGGKVIGNRIYANNPSITGTINGLYTYYVDTTLVANNEIIINTKASTTSGIYIDYPREVNYINNSVLVTGTGATQRALYWYTYANTNYSATINNNMFVANGSGTTAYALYLTANVGAYQNNHRLNYNNYYSSGTNLGYVGTARADLAAWKSVMTADNNSVNIRPSFIDPAINLKLTDYTGFDCPLLSEVPIDIDSTIRFDPTKIGCYEGDFRDNDIALVEFLGVMKAGITVGQTHPVSIVVQNRGLDTIQSLELEWFINDTTQGTVPVPVTSLVSGQLDTISLGSMDYVAGSHILKAQVNLVNGILDENSKNDTLELPYISCNSAESGLVIIGSSPAAKFSDIQSAVLALEQCGIAGGKVTLALENDTYNESVDFSKILMRSTDTLELISLSGNVDSVTVGDTILGIKMGDGDNISIKNITLNVKGIAVGILLGSGDNIEISGCKLNLDTTITTTSSHIVISKPENTGIANNVRIFNNIITGGYNAVAIAAGDTSAYGTDWVFDGNTIQRAYYHSMYIGYTDFLSISNNLCVPRIVNTTTGWYGMTIQICNVKVMQGNRIHGQRYAFSMPYGMFLHALNTNVAPAEIYNNEIILSKTGTSATIAHAITFQASSRANIYHNSVYVSETAASTNSGMYVSTDMATNVKNNNIVMTHSYPITVWTNVALDYNNYLTGGSIIGSFNGTTVADLATWKTLSGQDVNSVSVLPKFSNFPQSMDITDFEGILCPALPNVVTDINNTPRHANFVEMGAYELIPFPTEKARIKLHNFQSEAIFNQSVLIEVEVSNLSSVSISSIQFAYSLSGGTPVTRTWNASPSTDFKSTVIANLGTIIATADTTIEVWIVSVNNNLNALSDTVSGSYVMMPLAEFVNPLNGEAVFQLSLDVDVIIREGTGAPVSAPELYIHTTFGNNCIDEYDTIQMTQNANGTWTANIPQKYYGSKMVYETHVSDLIGNSIVLKDSTLIKFDPNIGASGSYTGDMQTVKLRPGSYEIEVWGADGGNGSGTKLGGKGGYSKGTLDVTSSTTLNIYVGGKGTDGTTIVGPGALGGWNGGGDAGAITVTNTYNGIGGGGGGATDVRLGDTTLTDRIIVAGGGGGVGSDGSTANGSAGGGITGGAATGTRDGDPGTQTAGGAAGTLMTTVAGMLPTAGALGIGGTGAGSNASGTCSGGGGGGGYYGGGGGGNSNVVNSSGGGGSGYIGGVTNGITVQFGQAGFVVNPDTSGNGYVRIIDTKTGKVVGLGDKEVYSGDHLGLMSLSSPAFDPNDVCEQPTLPVAILLANLGETDHDFTIDDITIEYEITDPMQFVYTGTKTINTGGLLSGESDDIELMASLPILSGTTTIKAWITTPDDFLCDDTIIATYTSQKIGMPYDEYFSGPFMPSEFTATPNDSTGWMVYHPDMNYPVQPDSAGTGMLRFAGGNGSMAILSTSRQLDIYGAVGAKLELWYYHDSTVFELDKSYTVVYIIADGVPYKVLNLRKRSDTAHSWTYYQVNLDPYASAQCVLVEFKSMNIDDNAAQYIDRIHIYSQHNMVVDTILIPDVTLCDYENKDIQVVIYNPTTQRLDFSAMPTQIYLEVTNGSDVQNFTHSLDTGFLDIRSYSTITVTALDLLEGETVIKAWVDSIDPEPSDDTTRLSIIVNPNIAVEVSNITQPEYCIAKEAEVWQEITLINHGDFDVSNILLTLAVYGIDTINETFIGTLSARSSQNYTFTQSFIVPIEESYSLRVIAELNCDIDMSDNEDGIMECVDLEDIEVKALLVPSGQIDTVGNVINLKVQLENLSPYHTYPSVMVHAQITAEGISPINLFEEILYFGNGVRDCEFNSLFAVPNVHNYTIKVFVTNVDQYPINDTIREYRATTSDVGISTINGTGLILGQNIPNPATHSTRIDYTIPTAGEVLFRVYSITGQTLHTEIVRTEAGSHSLNFNTSNLADGIYYYSMTFKGQCLVKKMNIQR